MQKKLTHEGVAALKTTGTEYGIGDTASPGLRIRVSAMGVKTFVFAYRSPVALKVRQLKIGHFPEVTLGAARTAADAARGEVKAGRDPQAIKIEAREATKNALPFREVRDRFIAAVIAGQRWAKRRKFITANIFADLEVDGVRKPKRRTRYLTPGEIREVWQALDTPAAYGMSHDAATALRLIFATAARPGMVCGMLAKELHDLDAPQPSAHLRLVGSDHHDGAVWILPHERMKRDDRKYESEEPFIVPLNALAVRLIEGAHGGANGRALGSPTLTGSKAMTPNKLAKCVRSLVKALGMKRWTPHDARRTAATMLGAIEVPGRAKFADHEIGWLLAHREGKASVACTTEIYNRNDHFDEKRHMATLLGAELERCIGSERVGLDRARFKRAA